VHDGCDRGAATTRCRRLAGHAGGGWPRSHAARTRTPNGLVGTAGADMTVATLPFLLVPLLTLGSIDRPQYVCINALGTGQLPTQAHIDSTLANLSGVKGSADGRRRLCMSEQWSVLGKNANVTKMAQQVDEFLALSLSNDIPVSMSIDATQWWEDAEHIWNWWNKSRTQTYNPTNVRNVEWAGSSPANATKISWRNWGSQFRITAAPGFFTPPPNFASPAYRQAAAEAMLPLVRRIAAWFAKLPDDKKYLLAYVRSTQELWQGTNYWYYNNGNALIKQNVSNDPKCGPKCGAQLGFAATCTVGACTGELTLAQLDATINSYCDFANQLLLGAGIPRSRTMCHTGFGTNPRATVHRGKQPLMNSPATSVTTSGAPGWSMYIGSSPVWTVGGFELNASLDAIDGTPWGAPEWMPFNLLANKGSSAQWEFAFEDILAFRNNRLVVMQNWNSLWQSKPITTVGIAALSTVIGRAPPCLVDAATAMHTTKLNATSFQLRWTPAGSGCETQQVLASAVSTRLASGALAAPTLLMSDQLSANVATDTLTLKSDPSLELVHWQVISQGCGGTQTAVSDTASLVI
jgi:hypothetical protein